MSAQSNDNTVTRDLRGLGALRPAEGLPRIVDPLGDTGHVLSDSLLFGHTRELDPTATMRTEAPIAVTPRTRRDMEIWVPEASQLPLLSLGSSGADVALASSMIIGDPKKKQGEEPDLSVTGILGEGGSGQVLSAFQRSMGREVAVKVPRESEPWFAPTLLAEGRLAGRVEHPNVIPIYALGKSDHGAPILVMKRMRGTDWETLLRDQNHGVWERFHHVEGRRDYIEHNLGILLAVVQGISAAHRAGVLHRDLKPANVLVAGPDEICIIDWGLALDLRDPHGAANLVGTPAFMAPEMLGGKNGSHPVGERTDVYELGAILHYLLSGRHRNAGATTDQILEGLRGPSQVKLPEAPKALADIVKRATAYDPKDRYPDAEAFGDAVRAWLDQRSAERIARSSDERLDQLAIALNDYRVAPESGRKPARQQLERMASGCRASIEDALALVPDLALAKSARLRYLDLWVNHLLDRNDVESARAELESAPGFAPHLEARLAQVENDADARMRRLHSLEQDMDLRPAARVRRLLFVSGIAWAVIATVVSWVLLPRLVHEDEAQRNGPLVIAGATNILFWMAVVAARKRLLSNSASRRIVMWVAVLLAFILLHRGSILLVGGGSFERAFAIELLMAGVMSLYATVAMVRGFWPATAVAFMGYAAALIWPHLAPHVFAASLISILVVAAQVWGRVSPQPSASEGQH